MGGHERRVPEIGVFLNADKDLRHPLSLLVFRVVSACRGENSLSGSRHMRCPTPAFRRPLRRGCKTPTEPRAAQAQEFQSVDLRRVPTWASRLLKPGCTAEAVKAVSRDGPLESPRQPQSPPPTPICRYRFGMRLTAHYWLLSARSRLASSSLGRSSCAAPTCFDVSERKTLFLGQRLECCALLQH